MKTSRLFSLPDPHSISFRQTWNLLMQTAGSRASQLRASLIGLCVAAAVQGLALSCLIPLFQTLMSHPPSWKTALLWLLTMLSLSLLSVVIRWWAQGFDFRGDMIRSTHELRSALGEQLRRIPMEALQDKQTGGISAALISNVDETLSYTLTVARMMIYALVTPITTVFIILWFDWRLALILLSAPLLLIPLYRWRRPAFRRGMRSLVAANEQASANILEFTQGLPTLRTARGVDAQLERLNASVKQLETIQRVGEQKGTKPNLIITTAMELTVLLGLFLGTLFVTQNTLDIAVLAAFLVIVVRYGEHLSTFVLYAKHITLIEAAVNNINAILSIQPLPQHIPTQSPQSFAIRFSNVSFSYVSANKHTLNQFNADFPINSLSALVGPSGAGKTTVTRLLMRHADPQIGNITIGGVDIRSISSERLNRLISAVFQDVYLFDDSILANIRMAKPNASDKEVEAAAHAAHCQDFINRLSNGYATRIGELGHRLSGGERQRISIARAILKNSPIVILDEPTASLDTENEIAVQKAIEALVCNRTLIVIAHRLSTIVAADQILVIDDGKVIESGKHAQLLARHSHYRKMWDAQQNSASWH